MIGKMGFAAALIVALASPAWADLASGQAAYLRGDYATAWRELKPLADQGNAEAQYQIAVMYDHGQAVSRSYQTAEQWYKSAAEQGHSGAQFNLGFMYYNGTGDDGGAVAQSFSDAAQWLTRAAAIGIGEAQHLLSTMYLRGDGVTRDGERAARLAASAARKGVPGARFNLGLLLSVSDDRDDKIEAYKWFALLALEHYPAAVENRDLMAESLSAAEVADGERRAEALLR